MARTLAQNRTLAASRALAGSRTLSANRNSVSEGGTAPTLVSATLTDYIPGSSSWLELVFSESVIRGGSGIGFVLTASGGAVSLTWTSSQSLSGTLTLATDRAIGQGETLTLAYTPGDIADADGEPLAAFSGFAVTNESTQ